MGIKGLHTIIKKYVEEVYTPRHLSHYAFKKVAVDISLYMFKYKATFREKWASAFINLISVLRKNDVHCVFIFDGKAPPEKEEERKNRAASRDKIETRVFDIEQSLDHYYQSGVVDDLLYKIWEDNANADKVASLLRSNVKRAFDVKIVETYHQNSRDKSSPSARLTLDSLKSSSISLRSPTSRPKERRRLTPLSCASEVW
jgi:hypothetical protein